MSQTIQHNPNFAYRPDIDGLRAVAILLVIIFHAFPKFLRGGFIGVDIFFVISGYLITSIILKNQSQNNFSLLDFYSRRIKRIFPALIVVLTFCLGAGWFILLGDEYEQLGKHIAAGSIYISNFVLQSEAGYFDVDSELKPLLHLWSLAIEEQFYLIFPLLLIVGKCFQISPLFIISTSLVFSFLANVIQIQDKTTDVFFFPYSRVWELLIGSLVAYLSIHSIAKNQTERFANSLSWIGVILILSAWIFLNSKEILFPSWWALLPTLGAACLIFAGEKAWFNRKILASKIAIFFGLISYPLYLWHWVLLSFLRITEVEKLSGLLKISVLIVSIIFAWLTYFFIEKNLRFQKSKFVSLGLLVSLLSMGSIGYFVMLQKGYPNRYKIEDNWIESITGNENFKKKRLVLKRICMDKFAARTDEKSFVDQGCLIENVSQEPSALLVGDSHAAHLYSGFIHSKVLTEGNLLHRGAGACFPFFDGSGEANKICPELINRFLEMAISTPSIKTVILAGRAVTELNEKTFIPKKAITDYVNAVSKNTDDAYSIFQNSMKKTLHRLTAANKKIVFVLDIPELEFEPTTCLSRPWRLSGEVSRLPCAISRSQVDSRRKKYLAIVTSILSEFPGITVLDPLPAFCDTQYCWAIKNDQMLYHDSHHLSQEGSIYLGEYFAHQLNLNDKTHGN
jgi:peptidoglycan/LPS O-acetylase OafA/YrhL